MSFWNLLRIGASGLAAQRLRLDIISNNIANAETTKTESGGPYQRQDVVFRPEGQPVFYPFLSQASQKLGRSVGSTPDLKSGGVRVAEIVTDKSAGAHVYDPNHPDADGDGYVTYPNVNLVVEMTNMLSATRSYEANLSVVTNARRMATKALEIGR